MVHPSSSTIISTSVSKVEIPVDKQLAGKYQVKHTHLVVLI